jgi:4a-hydroxytetrahydrobiopterin dehydratase
VPVDYETVTESEFDAAGLTNWTYEAGVIRADYVASSYPAATALAHRIAEAAEEAVHHPDINIRYPGRLQVFLTTHATGDLTTLDLELARRIDDLAAQA